MARSWNDETYPSGDPRRDNYVPDCDLADPAANGECGAMSNENVGGLAVTTRYAHDAFAGGARGATLGSVFNRSAVSGIISSYGPIWTLPTLVQDGRMIQFSSRLSF